METYELTYIILPEITAEEAEAKAKDMEFFIQGKDGVILKSEKPSAQTLSYHIKKNSSGFFVSLEFKALPDRIKDIKQKLEKDSKILRHIILKNEVKEKKVKRVRKPLFVSEEKEDTIKEVEQPKETASTEGSGESKEEKKIELGDIEKKLDEILGE